MFGQKEEWMEPMNKFISSHRQALKEYIDNMCSLPSERNTFALPASYSTPITILARLPPISREGFPSLPYLIDHARNFSALVKLWLDSTATREEDVELEGVLLEFHQHCIELQHRTDECLLKAEGSRPPDRQWDDIVQGLEISTLRDAADTEPEVQSLPWAEYTSTGSSGHSRAPGSSGSATDSKERAEKRGFWEETFGKDSRYQRPYDAADSSQARPPSRGHSGGKQPKGLLGSLRSWKGKDESPGSVRKEPMSALKELSPGTVYKESEH